MNKDAYKRMQDQKMRQDQNKQKLAIQLKNEQRDREMAECTFEPKISTTSQFGKQIKERIGDRTTKY